MKYLFLVMIMMSGFVPFASAAQLDAAIFFEEDVIEPSFEFLRVIYIEYPDGGEMSDLLHGTKQEISFVADSSVLEAKELLAQLNQNLMSVPSNAIITDSKIHYQAILQGNENYAVAEYKIQLFPTIVNHIVAKDSQQSIIDANWRGLSLSEPVLIQTKYGEFDINNPKSALAVMVPDVSELLHDVSIIEMPLLDASGIADLPLHRWHSLFDNTAIIPGAVEYKYTGKNVITHYSMGECNIFEGTCDDRIWVEDLHLDKKYTIRIIESRDDATIAIEGYVDATKIDGVDVFQTSLNAPVTQQPDTDEFPATIMYGMAGLAAVGAVVMFVISDQKLKRDKNEGQTGIDPAHLRAYSTSASAGGYKTNRGESYLIPYEKSKTPV